MNIINKVKWIAGIVLVFIIILTTNLIDQGNFDRLRYSVMTIYEDRIIANDLIFDISMLIREKEIAAATSDSLFFSNENDEVNRSVDELIERYEQTKLTSKERDIFDNLKEDLSKLARIEEESTGSILASKTDLLNKTNEVISDLHDLSKIQLDEGKTQMSNSNKVMEAIEVFTQVEIIFLIIMAAIVQIIILYKPKE